MHGDLWLQDRKPGDLTLRRDRTGADLWLRRRGPGDLRLRHPGNRQADLHATLPALRSLLEADQPNQAQAELHPALPPLQSQLQAEYANRAELAAALPPIVSHLDAAYDNAVWRGVESPACGRFQPGSARMRATIARLENTIRRRSETAVAWQPADSRYRALAAPFQGMAKRRAALAVVHQTARGVPVQPCAGWVDLARFPRPPVVSGWQSATPRLSRSCPAWRDLRRDVRPPVVAWFQSGRRFVQRWCGDWRDGLRTRLGYCWDWQAGRLRYGWGGAIVIHVPPPPPDPCRPVGRADLTLRLERTADLVLRRCRILPGPDGTPQPGPVVVIPVARVYVVANDVHLIRVSDGLELPAFALSLAIDVDSWAWQFSAELPADQLANVQPGTDPVEVEAQINTYAWRFLVEDIRRTRRFGQSRITVSGRGPAARLAAPYSPQVNRGNAIDLNATQILDDLLTDNGVPIGWTIDWQLTDWLVQAGAWNHTGTYLEGVLNVAEAAGAIVQADRTAQTLHLIHRYPVAPWDWPTAAPAYSIPEAIVVTEGVEWVEKPIYNAAYVSGQNLGILGHVVRSGTAGDLPAPMVVHSLITAQAAARQRGIAILADTGRQAVYTLSLPLDPAGIGIGLLEPCQLIEYGPAAIRGLVRSTRIEAKGAGVRQTVTLETRP